MPRCALAFCCLAPSVSHPGLFKAACGPDLARAAIKAQPTRFLSVPLARVLPLAQRTLAHCATPCLGREIKKNRQQSATWRPVPVRSIPLPATTRWAPWQTASKQGGGGRARKVCKEHGRHPAKEQSARHLRIKQADRLCLTASPTRCCQAAALFLSARLSDARAQ
jgi:hypothetical protein